jgi:hypothetical protein
MQAQAESHTYLNEYGYDHVRFSNRMDLLRAATQEKARRIYEQECKGPPAFNDKFRKAFIQKTLAMNNLE